jgi:hypothetical protein
MLKALKDNIAIQRVNTQPRASIRQKSTGKSEGENAMIILNLQHIESATETEVQGGCCHCWRPPGGRSKPKDLYYNQPLCSKAKAKAKALLESTP